MDESQLLALIYDSADIGMCVTDEQCNFVRVNKAYCKTYGYEPEELLGQPFTKVVPPHLREWAKELHSKYLDCQTDSSAGEWQVVHKNGSIRDIYVTAARLIAADGKRYKVTTVTDITDKKRIQEELHLKDRAISTARNSIIIADNRQPDLPIIYVNPAFEQMTGYELKEVLGKNCRFLQGKDTDPSARALMREAIEQGKDCSVVIKNYRKDGTPFWNEIYLSPVRDQSGAITHWFGIATDVTERKSIEEQLLRSQRMESLSTLTSGIAHDINNMLTPVLMGLKLMRSKITDEKGIKRLDVMEASLQRGAGLVRQMLSFARGAEGKYEKQSIEPIVKEVERLIRETFPKSISLLVKVSEKAWKVNADSIQLNQALLNLCINARDAMPNGGQLLISAENAVIDDAFAHRHPQATVGNYVAVTVSDTGTGIEPSVIERIFEPFFTTKDPDKGTGLGLAIVFSVVKRHSGFVVVKSTVGEGTTFTIYLPVAQSDAETIDDDSALMDKSKFILLVEDEAFVRDVAEDTLIEAGYKVITAKDGAEAVGIYAERKDEIALVLTDLVMPTMDGIAEIRILRRINPSVKVIVASGLLDKENMNRLAELDVVETLMKPYTTDTLMEAVENALSPAPPRMVQKVKGEKLNSREMRS